jgi:hypothetical protein
MLFLRQNLAASYAKKHGGGGETDEHRRKGIEFTEAKQFDKAIEEFNKEVVGSATKVGERRRTSLLLIVESNSRASRRRRDRSLVDIRFESSSTVTTPSSNKLTFAKTAPLI